MQKLTCNVLKSIVLRNIVLFLSLQTLVAQANDEALVLWYDQPAIKWEEALPLGNGRLGAMVYGGVQSETIQLNEDTFWAGGPHNNLNPAARKALPEIRRMINEGLYTQASKLAERSITSQGAHGMPYQTAGVLKINFPEHKNIQDYYRELNLSDAVSRTRYVVGKTQYQREIFSSFVDQAVVIRLSASEQGALNFSLDLSHPDNMEVNINADESSILMRGRSPDHEGIKGQVKLANLVKIINVDGSLHAENKQLEISGASEALILVSMATNFVNYQDVSGDELARAQQILQKAEQKFTAGPNAYKERLQSHRTFYKKYFDRVSLELGSNEFAKETTDKRIREFAHRVDPALVALYFQFGRYLLIASSQPGTQPANLQGIWNPHSKPAWDSKYTLNINAEMNYWPSEVTNLSELNEPFIQLIRDLSKTGQDAAQQMYGARGWVAHHNTDLWRISGAVDASWGPWPTSNAWLVQHLWQKYLYNGDMEYLRSVYPIMKSACEFFEDFLVRDEETGWLIVSPSMSPENEAQTTGLKIAAGVTMDNQLLFDLYTHSIAAAKILNEEKTTIKRWQEIISQLPPMQIGKYHQLQEWMHDWDNPADEHRHVSHLYGLYPGNQISPVKIPDLFNAARVSLEQRGDPSTGWSMNWKINLWARMLDGNRALKLIREQISPASEEVDKVSEGGGTYPNMFDAHPPFQIDGNFGFTSGVAEMLAQSHDGSVFLLPALPQAWPKGEVKGLVMRGGFVLDMSWNAGQISFLKVTSRLGGNLRIRTYSPLPEAQGFNVNSARGVNPNQYYATPKVKAPLKHTRLEYPQISLENTYLADIKTDVGDELVFDSFLRH